MRRTLLHLLFLLPMAIIAQIPVTDAATNTSIGLVNSQLTSINMQLKSMNKNLGRLVNLLEKNNNMTGKSKDILKEELEAKKKAPVYVTKSTDVERAIDLKDKILTAYRTSKNTVQSFKYLERQEVQDFLSYSAEAIIDTKNLFKQCKDIIKTRSIIHPEERLKRINTINGDLTGILDELIRYNGRLEQLNSFRKARTTLIDLNKD